MGNNQNKSYLFLFAVITVILLVVCSVYIYLQKKQLNQFVLEYVAESPVTPRISPITNYPLFTESEIQWAEQPTELDYLKIGWPKDWEKDIFGKMRNIDGRVITCTVHFVEEGANTYKGNQLTPYKVGSVMKDGYGKAEIIDVVSYYAFMNELDVYVKRFLKVGDTYLHLTSFAVAYSIDDSDECINVFLKDTWAYSEYYGNYKLFEKNFDLNFWEKYIKRTVFHDFR